VAEKKSFSRELKIGILVSIGLIILIFGINYLKGKSLFSTSKYYYAVYERVDGLLPSSPVMVRGLQVGLVDNVYFNPDNPKELIVKFIVQSKELKIPKGSEARIFSADLFGTKAVQLILTDNSEFITKGDTLTSSIQISIGDEINETVKPLKIKVESLVESLDSVLVVVQHIFNNKTQKGLISSFESINSSIKNFEHTSVELDALVTGERNRLSRIFENVESITKNFKANNEKLSNVFSNLDKITNDVAASNVKQTMLSLEKSLSDLSKVIDKVNSGEGTLGQLTQNDSLYRNLENASKNMDLLLEDMRLRPKRYVHFSVFGKKEKN
jgi:phospholipid/cholesterol/gamma-HCH transport system substrate-binding protein